MLASQKQFQRSQLLLDLGELKARLEKGWNSHGWGHGETRCIVGHVNGVVGRSDTDPVVRTSDDEAGDLRFGRMIWALYSTLLGPNAPQNVTVSQAARKIMHFNDRHANIGAVLLLIDRAVAYVMEQATEHVTATVA